MAVSLSVKDVPEELAKALRQRAVRNHRSIQGELMDILESTLRPKPFRIRELVKELRALNLHTASESARLIRADRDRR